MCADEMPVFEDKELTEQANRAVKKVVHHDHDEKNQNVITTERREL